MKPKSAPAAPNASAARPAIIAVVVAAAFLAGILAGGSLLAERGESAAKPNQPQAGPPAGPRPPAVALSPDAPAAGPAQGAAGQGAPPPGASGSAAEPPAFTEAPPIAPPPIPPEALAEGERVAAESLADDERPNGKVTTLVYDFESPEEAQKFEEQRRANWNRRLAREREIKVRIMREKCGLTDAQEPRLIAILDAEAAERQRLVEAMAAGTLSRTTFDEAVRANVRKAKDELAQLLTPEQLAAYQELKPREQVLREEAH